MTPSLASTFRIGCGAGFAADRLDPAVDLAHRGALDVLVFECLGERTLAFALRDRRADPERGYNRLLERRLRAVLGPCAARGTRIITNMGAANPAAAGRVARAIARELGLAGLRIAVLLGDEVSDRIGPDTPLWEGGTAAGVGRALIGANAYLGADALLAALESGAGLVICGRVADPSLFLAPLRAHFGWGEADWPRLGAGTAVGHLLECAGQVTGGYFADPGCKEVAGLARLGFPLAEVAADGCATITKLPGTGGRIDLQTVKEQLLYEIDDPACYLTPDVSADFSAVRLAEEGPDRVRIEGASGRARPAALKVTVAFDGGFLAEAGISYAGAGAIGRARLASEIVAERMRAVHGSEAALRIDLIGAGAPPPGIRGEHREPGDVRLRCALRSPAREEAERLLWEVEALLCCGPAGGGGYRGAITPAVLTRSASLPREQVHPRVELLEA